MYKIGLSNIVVPLSGEGLETFAIVYKALCKRKLPKEKEPKGNAKDGEYCQKKKAGQSWAHIDKSKEGDINETLSDDKKD